jgi:uncharacterized protein YvpB
MLRIWSAIKLTSIISLIVGLLFSGGLFSVLLYAEITGKPLSMLKKKPHPETTAFAQEINSPLSEEDKVSLSVQELVAKEDIPLPRKKDEAAVRAPLIKQYPELPAGCEVTSLAMLVNHYGIAKSKMDLAGEMKLDPTPIVWGANGTIKYWGNPHTGFVGDVTRKRAGFGIYHTALFELLERHIPTAVDLTGQSFDAIEQQVSDGIPVVVWTTIDFKPPQRWVQWDTPIGPFRTTLAEHAVLMVGYDEHNIYVNDPRTGLANAKIDKIQFIETWEIMGKQALSYLNQKQKKEE